MSEEPIGPNNLIIASTMILLTCMTQICHNVFFMERQVHQKSIGNYEFCTDCSEQSVNGETVHA